MVCKGAYRGSVSIVTADKRLIGPTLDITTDQGDIKIASCYSDQSKFSTRWGNMVLRNIHNESYITMQGVDSCTNVFMKKGELGIQISHVGNESRLHVDQHKILEFFPSSHDPGLCDCY